MAAGSSYSVERSDEEIDTVRNKIAQGMDRGTAYRGMSFEEGADEILRWLFGESDDEPFAEIELSDE